MLFRADLHIHTVLSPCGDLDMSPRNIIAMAKQKKLDIIGITDHNSTRQAIIIQEKAQKEGIFVLAGVEISTREEAHCLAFFPNRERLDEFQLFLDRHLPSIQNNPEKFGYQVVVDWDDQILYEEKRLLISALDLPIENIEHEVHRLEGIFIPAHIDKSCFSILSQLGFVPPDLRVEALELSPYTTKEAFLNGNNYLQNYAFIRSSDAHYVNDIGKVYTELSLSYPSFESINQAIRLL
ncbi:PHP domain-containing protein [Gabonibacter chumensis]|uniref:PHP domain-containing protein n=1 Tax=Gabonibacter chumensis TaxID=2972474 RepID=UPI002572AF57|nr:PHP domain-containing protein [Gabonibacter chumensis]MCR9013013.1 PHP domain-containing protein [Gabonibacter chumensis]